MSSTGAEPNTNYGSWEDFDEAGSKPATATISNPTSKNPGSVSGEALNNHKLRLLAALASLDRGLAANVSV